MLCECRRRGGSTHSRAGPNSRGSLGEGGRVGGGGALRGVRVAHFAADLLPPPRTPGAAAATVAGGVRTAARRHQRAHAGACHPSEPRIFTRLSCIYFFRCFVCGVCGVILRFCTATVSIELLIEGDVAWTITVSGTVLGATCLPRGMTVD